MARSKGLEVRGPGGLHCHLGLNPMALAHQQLSPPHTHAQVFKFGVYLAVPVCLYVGIAGDANVLNAIIKNVSFEGGGIAPSSGRCALHVEVRA